MSAAPPPPPDAHPLSRLALLGGTVLVLVLMIGPPAWLVGYEAWRSRPVPVPLRYLDVGRVGRRVDPADLSIPRVVQGQELLLVWRYCNDTGAPLPVTAARSMRSRQGHVVPLPQGGGTLATGCVERESRTTGYTDDLQPGLYWHLQGVATVRVGDRQWDVPYQTEEFLVVPPGGAGGQG